MLDCPTQVWKEIILYMVDFKEKMEITHVGSTTMQSAESRVKTMVQALVVAERHREVTRSFSRKEHKQEDQISTPFAPLPIPLLATVVLPPALLLLVVV